MPNSNQNISKSLESVEGVIDLCNLTYWGRYKMAAILQMMFSMHFLEWKILNLEYYFIEMCSVRSNWHIIIGADNSKYVGF